MVYDKHNGSDKFAAFYSKGYDQCLKEKSMLDTRSIPVHRISCKKMHALGIYRSGTVNSNSFVGKVLLRIKWKFELTYAL